MSLRSNLKSFYLPLAIFVLLGAVLRLWDWSSQIMLDDEWHALNFVLDKSLGNIFWTQGMGANSIPVNVYSWVLLHTFGWSEPLLHLPSLLAGLASLVLIPLLVRRIWGPVEALMVAALLAVSPVVIFYSRIARPYMPAMLLGCMSVLLLLLWLKEGHRRHLLVSALCGAFAVYYHLYAAIPVGVPYIVAIVAAWPGAKRFGLTTASDHPFRALIPACGLMALILTVFVVVPNLINPWWANPGIHGADRASTETAWGVLTLVAGTYLPGLVILVAIMFAAGLYLMLRQNRTMGLAILLPLGLFVTVMARTTQDGANAAIQVARYGISFFPLTFVIIAIALARTGALLKERLPFLQRKWALSAAAVGIWLPFLAFSPLWVTYSPPNNFTNHSAFQYRYEPKQWCESSPRRDLCPQYSLRFKDIPRFYLENPVLKQAKGIIEYPMLIGDHFNLHYYYQYFHGLPVMAGYFPDPDFSGDVETADWIGASSPLESVLGRIPPALAERCRWRTMVDMADMPSLVNNYKGWLVIVHLNPMKEIAGPSFPDNPGSPELARRLRLAQGEPLLINDKIAVWKLH